MTKPVISEHSKPKFDEPNFDDSNLDEFDELTLEELRSLLSNFKNLSKSEQMDLVQYMRKIETTDPEKVKKLKEFSTSNKTTDKPPQSRYFYCICSPSIHQLMQASVLPIKLLSPLAN